MARTFFLVFIFTCSFLFILEVLPATDKKRVFIEVAGEFDWLDQPLPAHQRSEGFFFGSYNEFYENCNGSNLNSVTAHPFPSNKTSGFYVIFNGKNVNISDSLIHCMVAEFGNKKIEHYFTANLHPGFMNLSPEYLQQQSDSSMVRAVDIVKLSHKDELKSYVRAFILSFTLIVLVLVGERLLRREDQFSKVS